MAKIGILGLEDVFSGGKVNIVDERLDKLKEMFKSKKKVYIQVEMIYDRSKIFEAGGIIADKNLELDLILSDLDFVETRLSRVETDEEKNLLNRFKDTLENEKFISEVELTDSEQKIVAGFGLLTILPIYLVNTEDADDKDAILFKAYYHFGYASFFTAAEKESRAWPIKKGMKAPEAAGVIHTDLQRGFIRAEVVHYEDLINSGHINAARQAGLLKLENKEYEVLDGDWMLFRFNK